MERINGMQSGSLPQSEWEGEEEVREHTLEAKRFYNSQRWKKCRASYISSVPGGICEHCNDAVGYIVDHVEEINMQNINNPEITLNHNNLQFLCLECHNRKTFKKYSSIREGFTFNEDGEFIPSSPHLNENS